MLFCSDYWHLLSYEALNSLTIPVILIQLNSCFYWLNHFNTFIACFLPQESLPDWVTYEQPASLVGGVALPALACNRTANSFCFYCLFLWRSETMRGGATFDSPIVHECFRNGCSLCVNDFFLCFVSFYIIAVVNKYVISWVFFWQAS